MKKAAAFILAVALLACAGIAIASPGDKNDPLVSKDYADTVYIPEMTEKSGEKITEELEKVYTEKTQAIREKITVDGYSYAESFTPVSVPKGKYLAVTAGGSMLLTSGTVKMHLSEGKVIDVTDGNEISSDASAVRGHRYVTDSDAVVSYEAQSAAKTMVKGFYTVSDTVVKVTTEPEVPEEVQIFKDVPVSAWYYKAVSYCYENDIIHGVSEDRFDTESLVTRGDYACIMYRMNGVQKPKGDSPFTDVTDKKLYYYDAVVWCSENKIVSGLGDGTFAPKNVINREQMMLLMYNYARFTGEDMTVSAPDGINAFKDAAEVSGWAKEAVQWAIEKGIVNGSNGYILPHDSARRCEMAQIVYNFMKYLEKSGR